MQPKSDVVVKPSRRRPPPQAPAPDKSLNGKSSDQLQHLLQALQAMRTGDFSVRMAGDWVGIEGKIADTFNEIVAANQRMASSLTSARWSGAKADPPRVNSVSSAPGRDEARQYAVDACYGRRVRLRSRSPRSPKAPAQTSASTSRPPAEGEFCSRRPSSTQIQHSACQSE